MFKPPQTFLLYPPPFQIPRNNPGRREGEGRREREGGGEKERWK